MGTAAIAGVCAVVGLAILIYRRRTVGPVFSATTGMDKAMYVVPGRGDRARHVEHRGQPASSAEYNYREGVSVWFRSIFLFQPTPS